jgi:hypothetical protein
MIGELRAAALVGRAFDWLRNTVQGTSRRW